MLNLASVLSIICTNQLHTCCKLLISTHSRASLLLSRCAHITSQASALWQVFFSPSVKSLLYSLSSQSPLFSHFSSLNVVVTEFKFLCTRIWINPTCHVCPSIHLVMITHADHQSRDGSRTLELVPPPTQQVCFMYRIQALHCILLGDRETNKDSCLTYRWVSN